MITIHELRKVYGSFVSLDNFTEAIQEGEIFGVIGQSGAGKSTLIRCINRLETPTSGTVMVDGQEITALSGKDLRRARQQSISSYFTIAYLECRETVAYCCCL